VTGAHRRARQIQAAWRRYKIRSLWAYVRTLPRVTALSVVRLHCDGSANYAAYSYGRGRPRPPAQLPVLRSWRTTEEHAERQRLQRLRDEERVSAELPTVLRGDDAAMRRLIATPPTPAHEAVLRKFGTMALPEPSPPELLFDHVRPAKGSAPLHSSRRRSGTRSPSRSRSRSHSRSPEPRASRVMVTSATGVTFSSEVLVLQPSTMALRVRDGDHTADDTSRQHWHSQHNRGTAAAAPSSKKHSQSGSSPVQADTADAACARVRGEPLSGPEYDVSPEVMEALRLYCVSDLKARYRQQQHDDRAAERRRKLPVSRRTKGRGRHARTPQQEARGVNDAATVNSSNVSVVDSDSQSDGGGSRSAADSDALESSRSGSRSTCSVATFSQPGTPVYRQRHGSMVLAYPIHGGGGGGGRGTGGSGGGAAAAAAASGGGGAGSGSGSGGGGGGGHGRHSRPLATAQRESRLSRSPPPAGDVATSESHDSHASRTSASPGSQDGDARHGAPPVIVGSTLRRQGAGNGMSPLSVDARHARGTNASPTSNAAHGSVNTKRMWKEIPLPPRPKT
jgi:hypothetical protein